MFPNPQSQLPFISQNNYSSMTTGPVSPHASATLAATTASESLQYAWATDQQA